MGGGRGRKVQEMIFIVNYIRTIIEPRGGEAKQLRTENFIFIGHDKWTELVQRKRFSLKKVQSFTSAMRCSLLPTRYSVVVHHNGIVEYSILCLLANRGVRCRRSPLLN